MPVAEPTAPVESPSAPMVGELHGLNVSFDHGICLRVQTPVGMVIVPLAPSICKDLPNALAQAVASQEQGAYPGLSRIH